MVSAFCENLTRVLKQDRLLQKVNQKGKKPLIEYIIGSFQFIIINACIAYGGWVPRNLAAGAADPKPR